MSACPSGCPGGHPAVPLSEAELGFLLDVLSWLCAEGLIGTLTMRRAMSALPRYDVTAGAGNYKNLSGSAAPRVVEGSAR
jgi:hypothetical protein